MTETACMHLSAPLAPGRYLLDAEGRLHPESACRREGMVAAVTLRLKARPSSAAKLAAPSVLEPEPGPRLERSLARRRPVPRAKSATAVAADDAAFEEFQERLAEVRQRRSAGKVIVVAKPRPKPVETTGARLAAALSRREVKAPPPPPKAPTRRALGTGECHRCGIPGRKGCEHFLPFEGS